MMAANTKRTKVAPEEIPMPPETLPRQIARSAEEEDRTPSWKKAEKIFALKLTAEFTV